MPKSRVGSIKDMEPEIKPSANSQRLLNRELSWLDFNERVLALAEDSTRPLLERAKFLAIFSTNLDEFFQVRVSGLREQMQAGIRTRSADGMDPLAQLQAIRLRVNELVSRHSRVFTGEIVDALSREQILFPEWETLDEQDRAELEALFRIRIYPVLTPLAVDPAHPFPFISNLSLNLAVTVHDPASGEQQFARIKIPSNLPRFIGLKDGHRFIPIEELISRNLAELFFGMQISGCQAFRVTRDADFELEDEAADLIEAIETVLVQRKRSGDVVRLEVGADMPADVLDMLCRELEFSLHEVNIVDGPLDLSGLSTIYKLDRPELKDEPWTPITPAALLRAEGTPDIFRTLRSRDILVHHPYESFAGSVEAFVEQAARDPKVLAIKQTLYRAGGPESTIVNALVRAADAGKQVVALVELKARFDEQTNVDRARDLEEAGVHVVYGLVGLKTHTKVLLIVREEPDGLRRYCHIGTGNYNAVTAGLYEDIGLLTADPEIGEDLTDLFNHLTGYARGKTYRKLLVAPNSLRGGMIERIRSQGSLGASGYIMMKMNSLVDPEIIDELYAAATAGAKIDLIIRGICCLRPGVPGLSEGIHVRSIVGRFLEHSRIYRFGADPTSAEYLIGSADMMPRNLDRRVEAITPITDPRLCARLEEMLTVELDDDTLAWSLGPDGDWSKVPTTRGVDTHATLGQRTRQRSLTS
ncbi:polyphosphate kinase 1 [Actinobacteria bacterium IMCC26256]|nr:polyphosphate kinase 1 [Actinobacteria bacterium IMCC26256]